MALSDDNQLVPTSGARRLRRSAGAGAPAAPPSAPAGQRADDRQAFEVDLAGVLRSVWRRKGIVVLVTVLGTALAVMAALAKPQTFTGYARVMLDTRNTDITGSNAVLSELNPTDEVVETEIELVLSREIKEEVALGLGIPTRLDRKAREPRPWFEEATDAALSALTNWVPESVAQALPGAPLEPALVEEGESATLDDAVEYLSNGLNAWQVGNTSVIEIAYTADDPFLAAEVANNTAQVYLSDQVALKEDATSTANLWLEGRIDELQSQLADKRREMAALREETGDFVDGQSLSSQRQTLINARLLEVRGQGIALATEVATLRSALNAGGATQLIAALNSGTVDQLRLNLAAANQRLAEVEAIYGPRHPLRQDAEARVQGTVADIEAEARRELNALENRLAALTDEQAQLQTELDAQTQAGQDLGESRTRVEALGAEIATIQELLDNYLTRFQETLEQQTVIRPDARVISEARAPEYPDPPSRKLIVLAGFLASGGLGVLLAFLRDAADRTVRSAADAEKALGVPVIAAVPSLPPRVAAKTPPADYALKEPASALVEASRRLLTGIGAHRAGEGTQVVLVTSAVAGEGKSSTAAVMARLLQRSGFSVALVECDLRRPTLAKTLGAVARPGLLQHLDGSVGREDVLQQDPSTGMTLVPAGGTSPDSLFLLQTEAMDKLVDWLAGTHDFVVLDSPPVLPLPDAGTLVGLADAVVYLCRWGQTPRGTSAAGAKSLREAADEVPVYAVLTQVDRKRYGHYDDSYGQAAYSHYYTD